MVAEPDRDRHGLFPINFYPNDSKSMIPTVYDSSVKYALTL